MNEPNEPSAKTSSWHKQSDEFQSIFNEGDNVEDLINDKQELNGQLENYKPQEGPQQITNQNMDPNSLAKSNSMLLSRFKCEEE